MGQDVVTEIMDDLVREEDEWHAAGVRALHALQREDIPRLQYEIEGLMLARGAEAARRLAQVDAPIRCELMSALVLSRNPLIASHAVDYLSTLGEPCVDILIDRLTEASPLVTMKILVALKATRSRRAVTPLAAMLAQATSPSVRFLIIEALGACGDRSLIPSLEPYLADEDFHVRDRTREAIDLLQANDG